MLYPLSFNIKEHATATQVLSIWCLPSNLGYEIKKGVHPITPIMLYDAHMAKKLSELLLKENIYVISFSYPVVPKNEARIRVQISASHSNDDLNYALECFYKAGKELNIIK